jgi:hypothetical protein
MYHRWMRLVKGKTCRFRVEVLVLIWISEALHKSLVETICDIETVLRRHHTTLRELNQEIHKNRSQLRDAQRDIIR